MFAAFPGPCRAACSGRLGDDRLGREDVFAIDAAFCSAEGVTIVGSGMPALTRSVQLTGLDVDALTRPQASADLC